MFTVLTKTAMFTVLTKTAMLTVLTKMPIFRAGQTRDNLLQQSHSVLNTKFVCLAQYSNIMCCNSILTLRGKIVLYFSMSKKPYNVVSLSLVAT